MQKTIIKTSLDGKTTIINQHAKQIINLKHLEDDNVKIIEHEIIKHKN